MSLVPLIALVNVKPMRMPALWSIQAIVASAPVCNGLLDIPEQCQAVELSTTMHALSDVWLAVVPLRKSYSSTSADVRPPREMKIPSQTRET